MAVNNPITTLAVTQHGSSLAGTNPAFSMIDDLGNLTNARTGAPAGLNNATVQFVSVGGVKRKLVDKLSEQLSVLDFGATGNGVTDDSGAIQTAINALATRGGGTLYLPAGRYRIANTLTVQSSNITLRGDGHPTWIDSASASTLKTVLIWGGGAAPMLSIVAPVGSSNDVLRSVSVLGLGFLGGGVATYGIQIGSLWYGDYDVYIESTTTALFYTFCVAQLAKHTDVQHLNVQIDGMQTSGTGCGVLLTGNVNSLPAASNTSLNRFKNVSMLMGATNDGVVCGNSDHNLFELVQIATPTPTSAYSVRFKAGLVNGDNARHNVVLVLLPVAAQVYSEGTEVNPIPATGNTVQAINFSQGSANPLIGTNSVLFWGSDSGTEITGATGIQQAAIAGDYATMQSAYSALGGESLRVASASSNQMLLTDATATNTWNENIDSTTGNLRMYSNTSSTAAMALIKNRFAACSPTVIATTGTLTAQMTAASTETLRLYNASSNHIRLTDGTNEFAMRINAAGPYLEFLRIAGSGGLQLSNATTATNTFTFGSNIGMTPSAAPATQAFGPVTANNTLAFLSFTTTLAAASSATCTVTNSVVTTNSRVLLSINSYSGTYGTNGWPYVTVDSVTTNSFVLRLNNTHASNALNGTIGIVCVVIN